MKESIRNKFLLSLYFSKYQKDKELGTKNDFIREFFEFNGNVRPKLSSEISGYYKQLTDELIVEDILILDHHIDAHGKEVPVYYVDRDNLVNYLKDIDYFKLVYMIIYSKHDKVFGVFPKLYSGSELKEMEEMLKG